MKPYVRVGHHAVDRARDRMKGLSEMSHYHIIQLIVRLFDQGIPFGGQSPPDFSLLVEHEGSEFVLIGARLEDGNVRVRTVLTKDQALANINANRNFRYHSRDGGIRRRRRV